MFSLFKTQPKTLDADSDDLLAETENEPSIAPGFIIATRNAWYRDMYRQSVKLNLGLSFALIITLFAAGYFYSTIPDPVYFATTKNGKLVKLVPLKQPNLSRDAVSQWAVQAVSHTMSFSWVNYKEHLTDSCNTYFTDSGCADFIGALKKAETLRAVKDRRMVIDGKVLSAPIFKQRGIKNGVYFWVMTMPILVTYSTNDKEITQQNTLRLVIHRVSTLESEHGIGIEIYQLTRQGKS